MCRGSVENIKFYESHKRNRKVEEKKSEALPKGIAVFLLSRGFGFHCCHLNTERFPLKLHFTTI